MFQGAPDLSLFQHAPFHTIPARDPLLFPWFFSELRIVDFLGPFFGGGELHRVPYNFDYSAKKCDFESRLFLYNSVFVRRPNLTVPYRILLFLSFFDPVWNLETEYRMHTRTRPLPPREGPRGELRIKTIDHKGPQMPTSRLPPIRDFDPTPLP